MTTSRDLYRKPGYWGILKDFVNRAVHGERHFPPWWLRDVGGGDFKATGQQFLHLFIELAGLQPDERVLDIGCGQGTFIKKMSTCGYTTVGVDPNQESIQGQNWRILKGFVEDFDFQSKPFDTICSFKALEHITDAKSILAYWKKLAKYRIILILPCQRYRKYVYDGHINFYPDEYQLRMQLGLGDSAVVKKIDGDWLVYEDTSKVEVS